MDPSSFGPSPRASRLSAIRLGRRPTPYRPAALDLGPGRQLDNTAGARRTVATGATGSSAAHLLAESPGQGHLGPSTRAGPRRPRRTGFSRSQPVRQVETAHVGLGSALPWPADPARGSRIPQPPTSAGVADCPYAMRHRRRSDRRSVRHPTLVGGPVLRLMRRVGPCIRPSACRRRASAIPVRRPAGSHLPFHLGLSGRCFDAASHHSYGDRQGISQGHPGASRSTGPRRALDSTEGERGQIRRAGTD